MSLIVSNIPEEIDIEEIRDIFNRYGRITSFKKIGNNFLINYQDARDAQDALNELNDQVLFDDQTINIKYVAPGQQVPINNLSVNLSTINNVYENWMRMGQKIKLLNYLLGKTYNSCLPITNYLKGYESTFVNDIANLTSFLKYLNGIALTPLELTNLSLSSLSGIFSPQQLLFDQIIDGFIDWLQKTLVICIQSHKGISILQQNYLQRRYLPESALYKQAAERFYTYK